MTCPQATDAESTANISIRHVASNYYDELGRVYLQVIKQF